MWSFWCPRSKRTHGHPHGAPIPKENKKHTYFSTMNLQACPAKCTLIFLRWISMVVGGCVGGGGRRWNNMLPLPRTEECLFENTHPVLKFFRYPNFPVPGFLHNEILREFSFLCNKEGSLRFHVQEMSVYKLFFFSFFWVHTTTYIHCTQIHTEVLSGLAFYFQLSFSHEKIIRGMLALITPISTHLSLTFYSLYCPKQFFHWSSLQNFI